MSEEFQSIDVNRAKQLEALFPISFFVVDGSIKGCNISLNADTHIRVVIDSYSVKFCERVMATEYILSWTVAGNTPVTRSFQHSDDLDQFVREHNLEGYHIEERRYIPSIGGNRPLIEGVTDDNPF